MRVLLLLTFLIPALVVCATGAGANVITVKPSNMQGWVQAVTGPAAAQVMFRDPAPPSRTDREGHSGTGAWYFYTGTADPNDPKQGNGWLGTNQFAGVRLDKLMKLEYKTWTDDSGLWMNRTGGGTYRGRQLNAPRQPIAPEILVDTDPNDLGNPQKQIYIMHRPIGARNMGMPGSGCERTLPAWPYRAWATRSLANDVWVVWVPTDTASMWNFRPGPRTDNTWYWSDILAAYPNAQVAASATQDALWPGGSWPAFSTLTGCAFNFVGGAQHFTAQSGIQSPLPGAWVNWFRDAYAMRQWLDDFTIAIDSPTGISETTFDFEADAPGPEKVVTTQGARVRAACGTGTVMTPEFARAYVRGHEHGARYHTFVMCGQVVGYDAQNKWGPGAKSFYIYDGHKKTEVFCPGYDMYLGFVVPGNWVRVKGLLQIDYGQFLPTDTSTEYNGGDPEPLPNELPITPCDIHPRMLCELSDIQLLLDLSPQ